MGNSSRPSLRVIQGEGSREICGEITFDGAGHELKCYAAPHHHSPLTADSHIFQRRWPFGSR